MFEKTRCSVVPDTWNSVLGHIRVFTDFEEGGGVKVLLFLSLSCSCRVRLWRV